MVTVFLQNRGQVFIELDIKNGRVVACRPLGEAMWKGLRVLNEEIKAGDLLWVWVPGAKEPVSLDYRVEEVKDKAQVAAGEPKVLNEHIREDPSVLRTSHPLVLYDELLDAPVVYLGGGSWCEVNGWGRLAKAAQLADLWHARKGGQY